MNEIVKVTGYNGKGCFWGVLADRTVYDTVVYLTKNTRLGVENSKIEFTDFCIGDSVRFSNLASGTLNSVDVDGICKIGKDNFTVHVNNLEHTIPMLNIGDIVHGRGGRYFVVEKVGSQGKIVHVSEKEYTDAYKLTPTGFAIGDTVKSNYCPVGIIEGVDQNQLVVDEYANNRKRHRIAISAAKKVVVIGAIPKDAKLLVDSNMMAYYEKEK